MRLIRLRRPRNPVDTQFSVKKFMDCASYPVKKLSDDQIERVVELIGRLEQVEDVRKIIELLT